MGTKQNQLQAHEAADLARLGKLASCNYLHQIKTCKCKGLYVWMPWAAAIISLGTAHTWQPGPEWHNEKSENIKPGSQGSKVRPG